MSPLATDSLIIIASESDIILQSISTDFMFYTFASRP